VRLERQAARAFPLGAIVGAATISACATLLLWTRAGLPLPRCAFRALTGVACPTCGSTRMLQALAEGDVPRAAAASPLVFLALVLLAAWTALSLARRRLVLDRREKRAAAALAATGLALGWLYAAWLGGGGIGTTGAGPSNASSRSNCARNSTENARSVTQIGSVSTVPT
jgi:hypothetical protein